MERTRERRAVGKLESVVWPDGKREDNADDSGPVVRGLVAPYYDGTPDTEFELWEGAVERYMPGAFESALEAGADVCCLWNHDTSHPLGRTINGTLRLFTTGRGLEYECLINDTTTGRDVAKLLARGDVFGSSAGFFVDFAEWRNDGNVDIRELRALELFDVSPCTFPAYKYTPTGLRSVRDEYKFWKQTLTGSPVELLQLQLELAELE